jgi:hypothetical protein
MSIGLSLLFPDDSIDLQLYRPVPWKSLIHDVLLPETAVALIQEDLGFTREKAIKTMRKSQLFGSILFPGDDSPHVQALIKYTHSTTRKGIGVKDEDVDSVLPPEESQAHWTESTIDGQVVLELVDD